MPIRSMDAFAPPSIRAEFTIGQRGRLVEAALLALALGFALFSLPGPPDATLDGSWQEMLVYAHGHRTQFGRDLIFTWGPWGYLCSLYHLGRAQAVPLLLWHTLGQLLIGFALVALTWDLKPWRRYAFVGLVLAVHALFLDATYFILISLVVVSGLMRRDAPVGRLIGWAFALGFLSQLKFTYLVLTAAGVAASAFCWAERRAWSRAGILAGAYILALVVAWIAAGQNLDNLYPYLRRSAEVAKGYADAMAWDEGWPAFLWGSGLAVICALYVLSLWRSLPERALAHGVAAFLAFAFFLMWKESFTRADLVPLGGHVLGLFAFVVGSAAALGGLLFPARRWHWFDASVPFCLVAVACFDPGFYTIGPRASWNGMRRGASALGTLFSLPGQWQQDLAQAADRQASPAIRKAVGDATVDVYDYNVGWALINGLAVAPRPLFQGYSAYTPSLEGWNLRYYQSNRAPEFLVWSSERLDARYPGEDDAMLVAGLPGHYAPMFSEGGYLLLRKQSPLSTVPMDRSLMIGRRILLSEEVALPADCRQAVWLQADAVPNNLGRVRAALYKPALINLATLDEQGRRRVWRLLPRVARVGFILIPTLESGPDVSAFLRGEAYSWVRSFHFEAPEGEGEFWSHVDVAVFGLPQIPLRPTIPAARLVEAGVFDRPPFAITSAAEPEIFPIPDGAAVLLHAESEVVLDVPVGAPGISGSFGLREGAYSGEGRTAGVGFVLEAVWPSGRRERLWSRALDPVARAQDRGVQHFAVRIPADRPLRLVVHMAPAVPGDNRWDWSYLAGVRFGTPEPR